MRKRKMNYFQNVFEQNKLLIHVKKICLGEIKFIRLIFQIFFLVTNLKSSQSALDYHELKRLQEISTDFEDREEAHHMFMKQYVSVIKPEEKRSWTAR